MVAEIRKLQQPGRAVHTWGSTEVLQTLLKNDLIDEYRLFIFPVVLGTGKRLFGSGTVPVALKQVESVTSGKGGTYHRFERYGSRSTGRSTLRSYSRRLAYRRARPSLAGATWESRAARARGRDPRAPIWRGVEVWAGCHSVCRAQHQVSLVRPSCASAGSVRLFRGGGRLLRIVGGVQWMSKGPCRGSERPSRPSPRRMVHLAGEEVVRARREVVRRSVHRIAHVKNERAGNRGELLVLGVPVRRDLFVAVGHLELDANGPFLEGSSCSTATWPPLRGVRWRITSFDLVGVDEHRSGFAAVCFFFASLPRAAGAAVSKARAISDDSVLVFIETSPCVGQSGSGHALTGRSPARCRGPMRPAPSDDR